MSFKTKDAALKYAWFLKIGIVALDQESIIFIISMFEYTQCKCDRPFESRGISYEM